MQSTRNSMDSVCMDCFKGRRKPMPDQDSGSELSSGPARKPGWFERNLGFMPKEKIPEESVITVDMQRKMGPAPSSKIMEEETEPPLTSANHEYHNDGSLKQFANLI